MFWSESAHFFAMSNVFRVQRYAKKTRNGISALHLFYNYRARFCNYPPPFLYIITTRVGCLTFGREPFCVRNHTNTAKEKIKPYLIVDNRVLVLFNRAVDFC